jgi:hypothetical protein
MRFIPAVIVLIRPTLIFLAALSGGINLLRKPHKSPVSRRPTMLSAPFYRPILNINLRHSSA